MPPYLPGHRLAHAVAAVAPELIGIVLDEAANAERSGEPRRISAPGSRIDVLVTDVGLPGGMNGRQVADAARASAERAKANAMAKSDRTPAAAAARQARASAVERFTQPWVTLLEPCAPDEAGLAWMNSPLLLIRTAHFSTTS